MPCSYLQLQKLDIKYGPKRLLRDFVEAMLELSQGGIEMFLHGSMHKIEGLFGPFVSRLASVSHLCL
jgi:hypothetical protein